MTLEGTPELHLAGRSRPAALPRRGGDRQPLRPRSSSAAACRRSSCCCTRADSDSRRGTARRLPGAVSGRSRTSCAARRSEVDVFLTGHTHAAYDCVIDRRRVTSAGSYGRLITRVDARDQPPHARRRARAGRQLGRRAGRDARARHDRADRALRAVRRPAARPRVIGRLASVGVAHARRLGREPDGQPGGRRAAARRPAPTPRSSTPASVRARARRRATSRTGARSSRSRSAPRW